MGRGGSGGHPNTAARTRIRLLGFGAVYSEPVTRIRSLGYGHSDTVTRIRSRLLGHGYSDTVTRPLLVTRIRSLGRYWLLGCGYSAVTRLLGAGYPDAAVDSDGGPEAAAAAGALARNLSESASAADSGFIRGQRQPRLYPSADSRFDSDAGVGRSVLHPILCPSAKRLSFGLVGA